MGLFLVTEKDQVTTVRCPPELNTQAAQELATLVTAWVQKPNKAYIFDFKDSTSISAIVFKPFALFHRALKKLDHYLVSVNMSNEVARQVQLAGLDSVFNAKPDLKSAMESAGLVFKKPSLDVNFINPFIHSTQSTIETQAQTKVLPGKLRLKREGEEIPVDIAGVISLTSNVFNGSIALCFPAAVFLHIYSNMIGETHTAISSEIEDAAGELLNIIFGQAKAELNTKGQYKIEKAIPTVVRGASLKVHHLTRSLAVVLPFETAAGLFHIEVAADGV